jgi:hypothetical protein
MAEKMRGEAVISGRVMGGACSLWAGCDAVLF